MMHVVKTEDAVIENPIQKYEYKDWLITIHRFFDTDKYLGFAQPIKYSHLYDFDTDDVEDVLVGQGILPPDYYDADDDHSNGNDMFYFKVDPTDDTMCFLQGVDLTSSASVLEYLVKEIHDYKTKSIKNIDSIEGFYESFMLDHRDIVVLKQIHRTPYPKSSKSRRGFMQVAWSAMVRERDKKCVKCSSIFDLHAHHIKSYVNNEELRYDVNNGITLCGVCHRRLHKEEGRELFEKE